MTRCEVCGSDRGMTFEVRAYGGAVHTFDSFDCAIHRMAPVCEHCRVTITGHAVEAEGHLYCSAYCAEVEGRRVSTYM
ncbi:hypothetical protein [Streptomyces rishiriensis]|uniref:hypothetical protein n=1 Tax=Streptomyces rishiriensis TaxID=68264 RepID=UPI0037CF31F9